ncbi:MAG: LysR family transcriptional regulator [Pseudomonadota bacterium]|nr:LysR family transcriptional regulator [Pseudomonadota bacterium]
MPDLRHLRHFEVLAEETNFSRAARRLGISQSTLSEQILRLEDVLGVRLFERTRSKVELTLAGEVLAGRLGSFMTGLQELIEDTRLAGENVRTKLSIGCSAMSLNTPMAAILQAYRKARPEVRITMVEQSSSDVIKSLTEKRHDCVFVPNPPRNDAIASTLVYEVPIVCCVAADHDLSGQTRVRLSDLNGLPVIMPKAGSRFGAFLMSAFMQANVVTHPVSNQSRPSISLTMVSAGAGVGFLPTNMSGMVPDGVVTRPLGVPPLAIPFRMAWLRSDRSPEIDHLIAALKATVKLPAKTEEPLLD